MNNAHDSLFALNSTAAISGKRPELIQGFERQRIIGFFLCVSNRPHPTLDVGTQGDVHPHPRYISMQVKCLSFVSKGKSDEVR